ncbi:hypothetical protein J7E24_07495 [Hymenobacter sp. ISL-91]|nr:hypothetical protein [Hymenobacter sp. ISL-91]MBT2557623.1 hypothetical protein [Hymenobacter sp. ISL-91]
MKKETPASTGHATPLPPACVALRDLYRTARHLPSTDPYTPARLARIAD